MQLEHVLIIWVALYEKTVPVTVQLTYFTNSRLSLELVPHKRPNALPSNTANSIECELILVT